MLKIRRVLATLTLVFLTAIALVAAPASAKDILASGEFEGQSGHVSSGKLTLKSDGGKMLVVLESSFKLDNAPSPTIGFAKNGEFDKATEFSKLNSLSGEQTYTVPANIDVAAYDAFVVWCSEYSVPLASAKLKKQ